MANLVDIPRSVTVGDAAITFLRINADCKIRCRMSSLKSLKTIGLASGVWKKRDGVENNVRQGSEYNKPADDIKCGYSFKAAVDFSDGTLDGTLSPGKKMVGCYAVEIPVGTSKLDLEVKASWLSSSKAKFEIPVPQ